MSTGLVAQGLEHAATNCGVGSSILSLPNNADLAINS